MQIVQNFKFEKTLLIWWIFLLQIFYWLAGNDSDAEETSPKRHLRSVVSEESFSKKFNDFEGKYLVIVQEKEAMKKKADREKKQREENENMKKYAFNNMLKTRQSDYSPEEIEEAVKKAEKEDKEENDCINGRIAAVLTDPPMAIEMPADFTPPPASLAILKGNH